jgi:hypothetical protein
MKILYKFASRSRPEKLVAGIRNIIDNSRHDQYIILLTLDSDDLTVPVGDLSALLMKYPGKIRINYGVSSGKIDAINRDMDRADLTADKAWDVLVNMSDDMQFIKPGFDLDILLDMCLYFPDTDGVLHYPDGFTGDKIITMSIMGRKYFERFGYIYHPEYKSLFCDNEFTEVAKMIGKYRFIEKNLYRHNHPAWGAGENDDQYRKTESYYMQDRDVWIVRKNKNYDLEKDLNSCMFIAPAGTSPEQPDEVAFTTDGRVACIGGDTHSD